MTRKQLFTLLATIVGSGMVILDGTVVNLALPALARELGAKFSDLQWIVDAYLLALSALILVGGSLGDIFGRKKVYVIGLVGFGLASLLCGFAPNLPVLIGLRVLQGVFGALLVPGALAIINTNFPDAQRGKAIGRWAGWSALAAAIGPLLGGYIVDAASWRWIFFINVPLAAVCLGLALHGMRDTRDEWPRRVDVAGAILGVLGLGGVTYGLIEGPVTHWATSSLVALAIGLASFVAFLLVERRHKDPMVHLSLFASRNFSAANLATFAMYGALSGFFFALVIFLQNTLGYSTLQAGASSLPITILLLTLSGRMGALAAKVGPRLFMTIGPLLAAAGMLYLYRLQPGVSYIMDIFPGVVLFGLGMAALVSPLTITVMNSVGKQDSGIASGINNAVSRAAGLIIIALLGLFGAAHAFRFTVLLCAGLAALAGVVSFALVRNPHSTR